MILHWVVYRDGRLFSEPHDMIHIKVNGKPIPPSGLPVTAGEPLVVTWVGNSVSMRFMDPMKDETCILRFRSNGTVDYGNMPPEGDATFIRKKGYW